MKKLVLQLALSCVCLGIPPILYSAPILDQQFIPTYGFMYAELRDELLRAQTFTVGISGLLSGFEVYLSGPGEGGTLTFKIYPTINGVPELASDSLAEATINVPTTLNDIPGFYGGDLKAFGLIVQVDDVYALVVQGSDQATWRGEYDEDIFPSTVHYAGGTAYGPTWTSDFGDLEGDLGFRTYVDSASVPEPASLLFLGTGLGGLALAAWRKRK